MKIKLDENMPARLVKALAKLGHDADTAQQEGLSGGEDPEVWNAAQKEGRFFVTQDNFFSDIRHHPPGTHCGVLLLRFSEPGRGEVYGRMVELFENADVAAWVGCNVIADGSRVRVRRP